MKYKTLLDRTWKTKRYINRVEIVLQPTDRSSPHGGYIFGVSIRVGKFENAIYFMFGKFNLEIKLLFHKKAHWTI